MPRWASSQIVVERPDTEIWIMQNQRRRGRAGRHRLLRHENTAANEGNDKNSAKANSSTKRAGLLHSHYLHDLTANVHVSTFAILRCFIPKAEDFCRSLIASLLR
jgi:hypothetical protein